MKITIERKVDKIIRSPVYCLSVGTHKYHYEKLGDAMFRVAVLFEPPREETERGELKKKSERFPLGKEILRILTENASPPGGWMSLDGIFEVAKAPKKYKKSNFGVVLSTLTRHKLIRVKETSEGKMYGGK